MTYNVWRATEEEPMVEGRPYPCYSLDGLFFLCCWL